MPVLTIIGVDNKRDRDTVAKIGRPVVFEEVRFGPAVCGPVPVLVTGLEGIYVTIREVGIVGPSSNLNFRQGLPQEPSDSGVETCQLLFSL